VDGVPKPIDPIMTVMGILLRIEADLKESDTCMQDGAETSWLQLTDARPSVATLQQARQLVHHMPEVHRARLVALSCGKGRDSVLDVS
jgi:hypothetical protein